MKTLLTQLALVAVVFGAGALTASIVTPKIYSPDPAETYMENSQPWSGMSFSTANVVEEYEYDDAYCLVYDDPDANMADVEICVDLETYQMVCQAVRDREEMTGSLVLNEDYSHGDVEVYTFMPEPETSVTEPAKVFKPIELVCSMPDYSQSK